MCLNQFYFYSTKYAGSFNSHRNFIFPYSTRNYSSVLLIELLHIYVFHSFLIVCVLYSQGLNFSCNFPLRVQTLADHPAAGKYLFTKERG